MVGTQITKLIADKVHATKRYHGVGGQWVKVINDATHLIYSSGYTNEQLADQLSVFSTHDL